MVLVASEMPAAVGAAGAIVHYLKHQLRRKIDHLASLRCDAPSDYVLLDAATQTNLELVESRGARDTSLLAALDRTVTPMGGRKLRALDSATAARSDRTELPAADDRRSVARIRFARRRLRESLKSIRDLERAAGRLSQARETRAIWSR